MNQPTDTPRTNEAKSYWDSAEREWCVSLQFARQLEREINEIRQALGDHGQRTHSELIDLCINAASWKSWREKFRKLDQGVRCEYCDPNGTIWECCKDRNKRTDEEIQKLREAYAKSVERDDFLTQENAKLKADLKRAVYIADWYIYRYDDPLASREEHNKQESLVLEIAAIKGQIK
jgi:hypothetical protein